MKEFWRLKPQDLPSNVGHGLSIGSRAHPCEQATRLKVRFKLSAREDNAVRLPRHKPNKAIVPAVLPDCSYNLSLSGMWIVSEYPGDVSELRNENAAKS